ncbi:MAG: hypothetical protein JWP74_2334 [Marmoricola sp.]|nr:hypothetical protein [Marmoricola sp.]
MSLVQTVLSVLCAIGILQLGVLIARDLRPGNVTLGFLVVIELGLVVQLVVGLHRVFGDHAGVSVATYLGYLVGALLILPIGVVWSSAERTRSGTAVLLVAVLVIPVLFLRLHDIWSTHV